MFIKRSYGEEDRKKWPSVLNADCVSSEESGEDDELYVKPLLWRSSLVEKFFVDLDDQFQQTKSSQAKRQTKTRILSEVPSMRPAPSDLPSWATN